MEKISFNKKLSDKVGMLLGSALQEDFEDKMAKLNKMLKEDKTYQGLVAAVNDYKNEAIIGFCPEVFDKVLTRLVRGASYTIRDCNIPKTYVDDVDIIEKAKSYHKELDSTAKLVSVITSINEKLETKVTRRAKDKDHVPFSITEVRQLIAGIEFMFFNDHEALRRHVNAGKLRK